MDDDRNPASQESRATALALGRCGRAWRRATGRIPPTCRRARATARLADLRGLPDPRPVHQPGRPGPSSRCPASGRSSAAATRCATSSRAGRSPRRFPLPARRPSPTATARCWSALTEGVSALVAAGRRPDGVAAGGAGPPARGRVPRAGAGDPRRRRGLRRRRRCGAGTGRPTWTTSNAPGCRSTSAPIR